MQRIISSPLDQRKSVPTNNNVEFKMAKLMKFVALAVVLCCFLSETVTATFWGDWGKVEKCPKGERATGFSLKTQPDQGNGDDTALNAIALSCSDGSWITSTEGPWLTSCQLRVEPRLDTKGDDSSANNLNCKCSKGELLYGDGLTWGDWNEWSGPCEKGIMAIQTRVEEYQGTGEDDTSLNDVKFTCFE